jgi:hypothetical protein
LTARLQELERQLADLKTRVATLEQLLELRAEHPVDRAAVRGKTVYDWQGPR